MSAQTMVAAAQRGDKLPSPSEKEECDHRWGGLGQADGARHG